MRLLILVRSPALERALRRMSDEVLPTARNYGTILSRPFVGAHYGGCGV